MSNAPTEITEDTYTVLTRLGMLMSAQSTLRNIVVLPKDQQSKIRIAINEIEDVLDWLRTQTEVTSIT